jgi:hypothetical protein
MMRLRLLIAFTLVLLVAVCVHGQQLENDSLNLRVDDQGWVTIHDKRSGATWQQAIPVSEGPSRSWISTGHPLTVTEFGSEKIPEVTGVTASDEKITISLKWKIPLVCHWSLSGIDTVRARLEARDQDATVSATGGWTVLYPPPFYAAKKADYAVVCEDEGVLYRTNEIDPQADPLRHASDSMGRSRSMPWSGLLDSDLASGMMTLVDTPFYAIEKMVFCDTSEGRRSLPAVQWEKGKHSTFEPRTVRFHSLWGANLINMFANESPTQHHAGPFHIERPEDYDRYMLGFNYGPQNRLPLFQLVFHDCVVCTRRWNDHYGRDMDHWRLSDLMSMVHGTPPIVKFMGDDTPHVMKEEFESVRKLYLRTFRDVCGWHEQIGLDEMTDHRFLSKDRLVQETRFSSGRAVVVNFGSEAWDDPRGFVVTGSSFHQFLVTIVNGEQKETLP